MLLLLCTTSSRIVHQDEGPMARTNGTKKIYRGICHILSMSYLVSGDVPSGVDAEGVHGVGITVEAHVLRLLALLLPLRDMGMDTTQDMRTSGMGTQSKTRGTIRGHDYRSGRHEWKTWCSYNRGGRHGEVIVVEDMV